MLLFNMPSLLEGFEIEVLVVLVLLVIGTQVKIFNDYRSFYTKTNRFQDIYEMYRYFAENKKISEIDSRTLHEVKCSIDLLNGKIVHLDANVKLFKEQSTSTKLYGIVQELNDRLDILKKNEKNN